MGFPILVRWHLYIESGPWNFVACMDAMMTSGYFWHYWPFVRGICQSRVDSPHKGPLMQSLGIFFAVSLNMLSNSRVAYDLRCHEADVDRVVQERRNSSALAMELCFSCINPSMCSHCSDCNMWLLSLISPQMTRPIVIKFTKWQFLQSISYSFQLVLYFMFGCR